MLSDFLFHYCLDTHRQKSLVLWQGVMTIQVQNVPSCHTPPHCVKAISEDAEIVWCTVLRHWHLLWIPAQFLLTKGKSYSMFWRNKLPLNICHLAKLRRTWQEMCNLWLHSLKASHQAQRLSRRLDGSTTILVTVREISRGLALPREETPAFPSGLALLGADSLKEVSKPKEDGMSHHLSVRYRGLINITWNMKHPTSP